MAEEAAAPRMTRSARLLWDGATGIIQDRADQAKAASLARPDLLRLQPAGGFGLVFRAEPTA